jgi:hypothetical protein
LSIMKVMRIPHPTNAAKQATSIACYIERKLMRNSNIVVWNNEFTFRETCPWLSVSCIRSPYCVFLTE